MGRERVAPDACPYSAELAREFSGCSMFEPQSFVPINWRGEPMAEHVTCRWLRVGGREDQYGPWYPRCALGGPPGFPLNLVSSRPQ